MIFLFAPMGYANSSKNFGKPVVLVDHAKIIDEIQTQYPQVQQSIFQAFYSAKQVDVVPPHKIQAFVRKNTKVDKHSKKDEVYLVKAKKLLNQGVQAYQQLEFDKAVKLLSDSRDEWIRNLSHLRSNRDLLKAHTYLAMSLLALKKQNPDRSIYQSQAEKELEKAVYLDTNLKLADRTYSPEVIQVYERVKQKVLQKPRVALKITANIKNANVYINGKLEGRAPTTLRLIPGTYYVLVEPKKGLATPWTKLMDLKRPVEEVQANVQPLINVAREQHLYRVREGADQQAQDVLFIRNRAKALDSDMVFLCKIERLDGLRMLGQLYDARTDEFSQVAFIQMGHDLRDLEGSSFDLVQALMSQIRNDGYLVNSTKPNLLQNQANFSSLGKKNKKDQSIHQAQAPKTKLYKKWWFWVGLAAIGAGGYFAITSQQGGSGGNIQINNDGNY